MRQAETSLSFRIAGIALPWSLLAMSICTPSLKAQTTTTKGANRFEDTITVVGGLEGRLARMRINRATTAESVAVIVRKATALLEETDKHLAKDLERVEKRQADLIKNRRKDAANALEPQRRRLLVSRCRVALLRGEIYYAAALALPDNAKARSAYLNSAVSVHRSLRLDYLDLSLALMGYLGEARAQRTAGQVKEAYKVLGPLLRMKVLPRDNLSAEVRRSAMLEKLEIHLVAAPADAIKEGVTWGKSKDLADKPLWRARIDWVLARALASEAVRLKKNSAKPNVVADTLTKAMNLIRSKPVIKVSSLYDRLALLVRLDALAGGKAMTREELLQWADALLATGRAGAVTFYRRAESMPGNPLSVQQQYNCAILLWKQGDLAAVADACDSLLKSLPSDHRQRPDVIKLRAAALTRLYHQTGADKRNASLSARFLAALQSVMESSLAQEVRRDALRQWVVVKSSQAGFSDCMDMLTKQSSLVKSDSYLLYARAVGRWSLLLGKSSTLDDSKATAEARQVLADCKAARKAAQRVGAKNLAARSAFLSAHVLAGPPLRDRQAALKILNEASKILKADNAVAGEATWLHVEILLDLGLTNAALKKLSNLSGTEATDSIQMLLRLAEALADRYVGSDATARRTVVNLCNRAIAGALGDGQKYAVTARRSARAMLKVGAHADAGGILKKLLESKIIRSDSQAVFACSLMLADALRQDGKMNDAKKQLEQLARKYPDSPDVHLALGRLEMDLKQPAVAAKCYRRARKLFKPGSEGWCEVTLALAEGLNTDGHAVAAGDILRVSGALYPRFGNPELLAKLKQLTQKLQYRTRKPS